MMAMIYTLLYSLLGSLFFSLFYPNAFKLYINGNGGFIGAYLNNSFFNSIVNVNPQIFYYTLLLLIFCVFLLSIQFKMKFLNNLVKSTMRRCFYKKSKKLYKRK